MQKQWCGVLGIACQLKQFQALFSQLYFHPSLDPPVQLFQVSGKSRINKGKITRMPERLIDADYFLLYRE